MASVTVKGMRCEHCKQAVAQAVAALPGVTDVDVDLASGKVQWRGDESAEAQKAVREAVFDAGFEAE